MANTMRATDWSKTTLGPPSNWSRALRMMVNFLLANRFPQLLWWGPEFCCVYNEAYVPILGEKHPSALGRPVSEVWKEIWHILKPLVETPFFGGPATWMEDLPLEINRHGFFEETHFTIAYSPVPDETVPSKIGGVLATVHEITDQVIGERRVHALRELGARSAEPKSFEEASRTIGDTLLPFANDVPFLLLYLIDDDGVTARLASCVGADPADRGCAELIVLDHNQEEVWPLSRVRATEQMELVEDLKTRFNIVPPGPWSEAPYNAAVVPVQSNLQHKLAGFIVVGISARIQFDQRYRAFLELMSNQIATMIANARAYRQERERAEALADLDSAKTAFFSNVSHELRTPLTLILGPVEDALLNETPPSPESLKMLHRNALRLLKLVNGVLDFVRIEVGRMQANYQATDLSLLTAQLASVFRSAVERAGLQLVIDCPPLPEPVYVDRDMWEKIVLNLLSNALKATFDGEIRVSISAEESGATLTVHDTGTGIAEGDLANLFERFRRIEGARRRSHEGSGIGLALVHELVTMHGGSIDVQSKLGDGTDFKVHLPYGHEHLKHGNIARDDSSPLLLQGSVVAYVQEALGWLPGHDQLEKEVAGSAAETSSTGHDSSATRPVVLLVDDNADMREYVRSLLAGRFNVITADNGRTALAEVRRRTPDLVLTDVMMPEMDGFALLETLREDSSTALIPVIMLSARAGEEARIEGVESGADDYLTKPFAARELIARVDAQLKMARMRREAADQKAALTQEINRARQFAGEALEHVPIAFCTMDCDYRITYMNAAAAQLGARSGKSLVGATFWDLYPEIIGTEVQTNVRRAMDQRVPVEFEQFFSSPEGEAWYQFNVYPQPGEGIILYCSNTTEARKSEQALRRSEQLAAAGRLAASIAHEINNPLEAVTNLLFLAKTDEGLSTSSKDLLEIADKELQRLSHITARSLKFYRQRTAPAATGLDEVLDSVIYFHDPVIRVRGIQIERRFRPAPQVLCQPGEIQQVFTNLISNALDAIPDKGRLILEVRPVTTPASGVAVTVADNGSGMDKHMLARLFHPFVTTKGEAGTGLGLWVSKGILDKHHATVAVRTRPNCGAVFRLFFPTSTL